MNRFIVIFFLLACVILGQAQVSFDLRTRDNQTEYKLNEPIIVDVVINDEGVSMLNNKRFHLSFGEEGTKGFQTIDAYIKGKTTSVSVPCCETAQVLRINASISLVDTVLSKQIGVVIDSDNLARTTVLPKDFSAFWKDELKALENVALDPKMEHVATLSSELVDVYHINYAVDQTGSRFYGVLTIPKSNDSNKRYPAVVIYPGAGVRPYVAHTRFAEAGIVTLQVGIHGIPINLEPLAYTALAKGALHDYPYFNVQSKELYYFNRVIKGSVRALDFLQTIDQVDSERIMVSGSSQGGALSLITTGLDGRVKAVAAYCPALCQTNGFVFEKASGWPRPAMQKSENEIYLANWTNIMPYYDVVNFVRDIQVPVFMTWGLIDDVTPATTIFAAYNSISSMKRNYLLADVAHANHPTQVSAVYDFITNFFEGK